VTSVSAGSVLYENKLEYRSGRRKYSEWSSAQGKLFLKELDRGYEALSEKIVEELFLLHDFSGKRESGKTAENQILEAPRA